MTCYYISKDQYRSYIGAALKDIDAKLHNLSNMRPVEMWIAPFDNNDGSVKFQWPYFNDVKGKMVEVSPVIQAQITSSISLDDEEDDGCTMVVKGMHHNLPEWVEQVGKDGTWLPKDSPTSNFTKYYLLAHQDVFGKLEPLPCKRFDFRMSLLEIPHASRLFCYQMRCLIYSWPTGIDKDHVYLDNIKSLDWEGLLIAHVVWLPLQLV
jgi:hypothetical protein